QPPEGHVRDRGALPRDDRGGRARAPGGRQPEHARRAARHLPRAHRARPQERAGRRRGRRTGAAGGGMGETGTHPGRKRGGGSHGRRRKGDHGGGHEGGDERWLLTYADMITLLMALFIVMWAISSVNTTKFAELSVSLKQAFNGKLVEGGDNIEAGAS